MLRRLPSWIWLLLALGFGGAATIMAMGWLKVQSGKQAQASDTVPVVVAVKEVGAATFLTGSQVMVRSWPKDSRPSGGFSQVEPVLGRVSRYSLGPGEPILESKLAPKGARAGLTALVPAHKRAMTVKVDEASGVAGFISPGNRVDVVVTLSRGEFSKDPFSKLVLENLLVLGTGQKIEKPEGDKPQVFPTVTLELTPEEGERLALATQEGHIVLILRSQEDKQLAHTRGVRTSLLLSRTMSGPEDKPRRRAMVEVLRGMDRKSVTF